MSKVMLVEDDDSLREIYSIRLTAEGYTIVTAHDGEEALAIAVKERPDLIISDIMMPKISGFDMLDILRSTPETQNIKVIMMTALSSEDERLRGESLGANRYLVKSQVGIEDVVNAVHDVLGDRTTDGVINTSTSMNDPAMPSQPAPAPADAAAITPAAVPVAADPNTVPAAAATDPGAVPMNTAAEANVAQSVVPAPTNNAAEATAPVAVPTAPTDMTNATIESAAPMVSGGMANATVDGSGPAPAPADATNTNVENAAPANAAAAPLAQPEVSQQPPAEIPVQNTAPASTPAPVNPAATAPATPAEPAMASANSEQIVTSAANPALNTSSASVEQPAAPQQNPAPAPPIAPPAV